MTRKDKYYGTLIMIHGEKLDKIREKGYKGSHFQFRAVCKAKSLSEASRIAEGYGFGRNAFRKDYTSETGNALELEMADKYGFIVSIDGTRGDTFIDVREII